MELNGICINCFNPTGGEEVCMHCGYIQTDKPKQLCHLYPHSVLNDRYIIGTVINNGGFGVVYKAFDMKLQTVVAIKELLPTQNCIVNRVPGTGNVIPVGEKREEQFEILKEKFLDEARMMAQFSDCESIVHVYDFFEANNTAYLVMEYLDGQTLRQYIGYENNRMSYDEAINIIMPIMEALKVAHSHHVIHRDVSPDNIFICKNGKIKLIDFGAAKFNENEVTENATSLVLKPGYAPPEQYRSKAKIGVQADIYSLGAVLYSVLTGEIPEESIDRMEKDNLEKLSKKGVELPAYAEKSIMKAMALREGARFKSMEAFIFAIKGEKKADFPEEELRKKKIIRTLGIVAVFIILISSVLITYKVKNYNSIIPAKSETITMWYIDNGDAGLNERWENVEKYFSEFMCNLKVNADLSKTNVEIIGIPEDEYKEKLEEAFKNGTAPDVYESSGESFDEYAYSLENLYKELDKSEFEAVFDVMKDKYAVKNKIAVCFDVPVLYTYTDFGYLSAPATSVSLDDLLKAKSKSGDFAYSLVCNPDALLYASYSYGYDGGEDMTVVNKLFDASCIYNKEGKYVSPATIFVKTTKNSQYYIGFMSEYSEISKNSRAGQSSFAVTGLTGENVGDYYIFPEVWSISKQSSNSKRQTAAMLLYYMACYGQSDVTKSNKNTCYLPMYSEAVDGIGYSDKYSVVYDSSRSNVEVSLYNYDSIKAQAEEISKVIQRKDCSFKDVEKILVSK